jgi:hypothetical protein
MFTKAIHYNIVRNIYPPGKRRQLTHFFSLYDYQALTKISATSIERNFNISCSIKLQ